MEAGDRGDRGDDSPLAAAPVGDVSDASAEAAPVSRFMEPRGEAAGVMWAEERHEGLAGVAEAPLASDLHDEKTEE